MAGGEGDINEIIISVESGSKRENQYRRNGGNNRGGKQRGVRNRRKLSAKKCENIGEIEEMASAYHQNKRSKNNGAKARRPSRKAAKSNGENNGEETVENMKIIGKSMKARSVIAKADAAYQQ